MLDKELFDLIHALDSDSKSESKEAEQELIQSLEPIIRAWAEIYAEYGDYRISIDSKYDPSRGEITGVSYDKAKGRLVFRYVDTGGAEDYIYAATDIVSPEFLKRKRKEVKYLAKLDTNRKLSELREIINELEGFLSKIDSSDDEYVE